MNEWIKCGDRLPDEPKYRDNYIVYGYPTCGTHSEDKIVMEAFYIGDGHFEFGEYDCGIEVSHWMPLPKAPNE